jgi:hypothetical protein
VNKRLGAAIVATIGRGGEAPDAYAARLVGQPQIVVSNGRAKEMAAIVYEATSLQTGEKYLATRIHDLQFAFDRDQPVESLDGTESAPKSWQDLVREQSQKALAFAMGRPSAPASLSVQDIEPEAV